MFAWPEFERAYELFSAGEPLPLYIQTVGPGHEFWDDPEEHIDIIRGSKRVFDSALRFWVHAFRFVCLRDREQNHSLYPRSEWPDVESELRKIAMHPLNNLCQPIPEQALSTLVGNCTRDLKQPSFTLDLQGQFADALLMSDDWNDKAVLCETDDGYVAFFWDTSA